MVAVAESDLRRIAKAKLRAAQSVDKIIGTVAKANPIIGTIDGDHRSPAPLPSEIVSEP